MPREDINGEPIHRSTLKRKEVPFLSGTGEHIQAKIDREKDDIQPRETQEIPEVLPHDIHPTAAEKRLGRHIVGLRHAQGERDDYTRTREMKAIKVEQEDEL